LKHLDLRDARARLRAILGAVQAIDRRLQEIQRAITVLSQQASGTGIEAQRARLALASLRIQHGQLVVERAGGVSNQLDPALKRSEAALAAYDAAKKALQECLDRQAREADVEGFGIACRLDWGCLAWCSVDAWLGPLSLALSAKKMLLDRTALHVATKTVRHVAEAKVVVKSLKVFASVVSKANFAISAAQQALCLVDCLDWESAKEQAAPSEGTSAGTSAGSRGSSSGTPGGGDPLDRPVGIGAGYPGTPGLDVGGQLMP
jgi:hypothetical protein